MLLVRLLLIQIGTLFPPALPFATLVIQNGGAGIFLGCSAVAAMGDFDFGGLPGEGAHWSLSTALPSPSRHIDFSGAAPYAQLADTSDYLHYSFLSLQELSPKSSIS